ncbi:membrane protein [Schlesneria paludicola]|uniref:membrane protein n=1 Tax=Schlesneria paludicola TaxID=360056 RepID=UPI000299F078|nr:membrane protein [Schlesneria paludicola]
MNTVRSLTFIWAPWVIVASVLVVAVTAGLCFLAWKRTGFRRSIGILELLRFSIVCLVAVLFNQPEWVEEFRPEEKPTIAVLWDHSASMETRDVTNTEPPSTTVTTRREAIQQLTQPEFWSSLQQKQSVVIQSFGGADPNSASAAIHGTNLNEPLAEAPRQFKNLRAIVMASDGDWNEGEPPVQAASALRLKGIPVFTIPVGSSSRLPDVELLSLDSPTFGITGKSIRIPFTIDSTLPREHVTTVVLKTSDGDEVTKEIRIAPMGRTSEWLIWKPKTTGDYTLSLEIPKQPDELVPDNNKLSTPIAIREEKLRVLVVESLPRWEYRYLRNALSRDPGVEVSCLLFHPGLSKAGGGNKDYIKQFPKGLDELSKFDVVFLGDVGMEDGQLSAEDCRLLKGLVEHQASGLVFMPGWQGKQASLVESEVGDLCPVVFDHSQPGGWGSRTASHFELTELGRRSLLTKLADTQDDNIEVWEGLPGFQWYAPALRAKAGCEVLAVHKDVSNEFGRLPLLATRTFGAGKVLFMGTDGAWRWRKGVEDKYHYRFWGQVVRWMAYQRNMAKGETMRLYYSPEQPQVRQTIALSANVMEKSGEPLPKGDVTARIVAPSGKAETVRFSSSGDEWGAFASRFTAEEPGKHEVTLTCKQTGAVLDATFFVQGSAIERIGRAARPEVLEEIARVSQGQTMTLDRLEQVLKTLAALPEPPPSVRRVQLWCHPFVASVLVLLLGAFWIGRKVVGLI